jgi:spermidine/putrescine transport system permease protein
MVQSENASISPLKDNNALPGAPKRRWNSDTIIWLLICSVPVLAICGPLANFLIIGFWRVDGSTMIADFSLHNYATFITNPTYKAVLLKTMLLAAEVALVSILFGFAIAYFIWKCPRPAHFALLVASAIPLLMSYIIKLYAIRSILGLDGLLNTLLVTSGILERPSGIFLFNQFAILLAMSIIYLPFSILPIYLTLERIPENLLQASADLGASAWQTFRYVVLPASLPGGIIGGMFSYILALGDFVTPQMVGGVQGFTFGRVIWSQFGMAFDWPFGAAMSTVLLFLSLGVIGLAGKLVKQAEVE